MGHQDRVFAPRFTFAEEDLIVLDGRSMRLEYRNTEGCVLVASGGPGVPEHFTHAELSDLVRQNRLEVRRGHFLQAADRHRLEATCLLQSGMSGKGEERMRYREALVLGFHHVRDEQIARDGTASLVRTDASIERHRAAIEKAARPFYAKYATNQKAPASPEKFSARALRGWLKLHDRFGRLGLSDAYANSGNRDARLGAQVREIMNAEVRGYLSPSRPTKVTIYNNVAAVVAMQNDERRAAGLPLLKAPSRAAVSRAIDRLDPFTVAVAREGREAAMRRLRVTGSGLKPDVVRPLQRVEMDEMKIDLFASLKGSGLLDRVSEADQARLGITPKKGRWWVTVAACVATKVILGMRLSRNPNQFSALDCLEMSLTDKTGSACAVDALSPWTMGGLPELLVTDGGSAFKAASVRAACADLGMRHEIAVNGVPQLRGSIERFFGTLNAGLLPKLSGRSFESIAARGDHDGAADAALDVDDLTRALVRWVVDVYHNTPHAGIEGRTPLQAWEEGLREWGVCPPPGPGLLAQIFARPMRRSLEGDGVTIMGVRYQSRALAEYRIRARAGVVDCRWYHGDLGAIWVKAGDWIRVPAAIGGFAGVSASEWHAAAANLRAALQPGREIARDVALRALREIGEIDGAARRRAGLVSDTGIRT